MTVQCPWCDYEGLVSSVEAHISGKTDEAHRGKVGHDLKAHLPQIDDPEEPGEDTSESDVSATLPDLPEPGEDTSEAPGWALVAATVLFALVVLLLVYDSGGSGGSASAAIEDDQDADQDGEEPALIEA